MSEEPAVREQMPMPVIDAYAPEPAGGAMAAAATPTLRRAGNLAGMWRFFRDPHASLLGKVLVVLAFVYVISPIDFIPDVLPVLGWIDDVIVLVIALVYLFRVAQPYRTRPPVRKIRGG